MRSSSTIIALVVFLCSSFAALEARAQTDPKLVKEDKTSRGDVKVDGWNGHLTIGSNLNVSSNRNVVGETDGFTALFGLNLDGALNYASGPHELHNSLTLIESFARTPSIERFVKNTDTLALGSLYQYFFLPWSGLFGEATFEASLFTTNNVTGDRHDYLIERTDGTTDTFNQVRSFEMANPLSPTSLSETVGVFFKPVRETPFTLSFRTGIGARETFARDVLTVADDSETDPIEVKELQNVYQAGAEGFVGIQGSFPEEDISYEIGATGFLPVINNAEGTPSPFELFRYGANGTVSFQALEWMSLSYNARILRDPQLIDRTQVQTNLLLNFTYSLIEPRKPEEEEKAEGGEKNSG